MESGPIPRIGVAVFVMDSSTGSPRFLMGKRLGSHGAGTWALPGGHLEYGESFELCAARETLEETGLHLTGVEFLTATNTVFTAENKHYVTIFMRAVIDVGKHEGGMPQPKLMEPNKCAGWEWKSMADLTEAYERRNDGDDGTMPLFLPMISLLEQQRTACKRLA